jgi:hypothetical protein
MSSITAVGVRLGIFGPPPKPPARSLLKTPGVLVDTDGRWLNGVVQQNYPIPKPNDWNPCEADPNTKSSDSGADKPTFDPFAIYITVECTTAAVEGLRDRAVTSLEAGTSYGLELALAVGGIGVGGNTNPFLGDGNVVTLAGGAAMPPREGMALLEDQIGRVYGAAGVIHASPGTVDLLSSILESDDSGGLYTQAGTPVIPGQGYIDAPSNGVSPADPTQQWMFASGQVEVHLTDVIVRDLVSSLDRSTNLVEFVVERFALVNWDTEIQAAVLVDFDLASS